MVKLVAAAMVVVLLWAQGVLAQDEGDLSEKEALAEAMARNPDRFETAMLDLIAGFGGPSGLTRDGIEDHIALERASARASAMRRLHAMDLNGDGAVGPEELQVAQRAASAGTRGRMERQVTVADADADGKVSSNEIEADGKAAAMRALGQEEEALLYSVLTLDADDDGALGADELRTAMTRAGDET